MEFNRLIIPTPFQCPYIILVMYRVYETVSKWHSPKLEIYCIMRNVILALWFKNYRVSVIPIPYHHAHLNSIPPCSFQFHTTVFIPIPHHRVHSNSTPPCTFQFHATVFIPIPRHHVHSNSIPPCSIPLCFENYRVSEAVIHAW